jgi:ABC-type amino acid transport substrate-binding protein
VKVRARIGMLAPAVALATLALAPAVASAAQTLEHIRDRHGITFAYRDAALPFSFAGRDKQPRGYSVELCERIARAIQRQLGLAALDVRWIAVDADTRLEAVATGRADAECGTTTIALSRMQRVDFSLPIFVDGGALLVRARSAVQRAADLDGRRVAVIRGTTTERALSDALDFAGARAVIVPVTNPEDGANAVREGRADAYAGDRLVLTGLVMAADGKPATADADKSPAADAGKLAVLPEDISVEPYGIVVRRDDPDFRLAVNRALVELYKRGEIDAIFKHWLAPLGSPSALLNAMWYLNALPE